MAKTAKKTGRKTAKKSAKRSAAGKRAAKKTTAKKNKLGVKNSLVNNINARKKKGKSRPKKKINCFEEVVWGNEEKLGKKIIPRH